MADRREAISRLGVPRCAECGALEEAQASVVAHTMKGGVSEESLCCSAKCSVSFLDRMHSGTARLMNSKKTGVIATKQPGKQIGVWPKGRRKIEVENRRAARNANG